MWLVTGWAAMVARLRALVTPQIPEGQRCSFCPARAVSHDSTIDYSGGVLNARPGVTVRRCLDHPPADAVLTPCPDCGRPFWPDPFHFDCEPEGADRG